MDPTKNTAGLGADPDSRSEKNTLYPNRNGEDGGNPKVTDRPVRFTEGFTMTPPNESRHKALKMVAQKEEEKLQQLKDARRVPSVNLPPERLGGMITLAEARQKQFADSLSLKLKKKIAKEDSDKMRRQNEEEELQHMKAKQREKAEQLEERKLQEERERKDRLHQHHLRTTDKFLQRFETRVPSELPSSSVRHMSSWNMNIDSNLKETVKDQFLDSRSANTNFLVKPSEPQCDGIRETEHSSPFFADFTDQPFRSPESSQPQPHLETGPKLSRISEKAETDSNPDCDRPLVNLMRAFPDCSIDFLKDILDQCSGDQVQAYALLNI